MAIWPWTGVTRVANLRSEGLRSAFISIWRVGSDARYELVVAVVSCFHQRWFTVVYSCTTRYCGTQAEKHWTTINVTCIGLQGEATPHQPCEWMLWVGGRKTRYVTTDVRVTLPVLVHVVTTRADNDCAIRLHTMLQRPIAIGPSMPWLDYGTCRLA